MRIGKIDYLNLLPFEVFMKAFPVSLQTKAVMAYKKSYPSKLNRDFLFGRLDGGFLSSIMACGQGKIALPCGIIADGEVWSVLALPNPNKKDYQSASSNALIQVLGIEGEVLIGDRALIYKMSGGEGIDLGQRWKEKKGLPFVFGLFCVSKQKQRAEKIILKFAQAKVKIPQYILQKASQKSGVAKKDIVRYLEKIQYRIGCKEKRALEVFYRELLFHKIKKPKRF
ncbi:MqnA/MqnD/SBP family protein [Helicobacter kayseriensis]|uniref:MqnA/MqnD/SBP family protein n=1 Tax=Helicobacter kayseriensis TaxID=2905877 RepID=UPI001E5C7218|nr:MqnA/MqnD/SBP family protein [Helicobacter kayseriensis]MCE3047100.1 menaquinone biosynthesis protein [Helicobacter kayseriensis]MCE3048240.1 menaquinone biosynthesis protein [Helicobacter kayseriensis]